MGQVIQSHGMHFFELSGPDLLLGFDADPAIRNVLGLAHTAPEIAVKAVGLRRFGQKIISHPRRTPRSPELCCGRRSQQSLACQRTGSILTDIDATLETARMGCQHHEGLGATQYGRHQQVRRVEQRLYENRQRRRSLDLYDGDIRLVDRQASNSKNSQAVTISISSPNTWRIGHISNSPITKS